MHREPSRHTSTTIPAFSTVTSVPFPGSVPTAYRALLLSAVLAAVALFSSISCTPPPIAKKCPKPVWKAYTHLQPQDVAHELSLLERMLDSATAENSLIDEQNDSTASGKLTLLEIYQRLFELSIHHSNPNYDSKKTYDYLTYLYQHGGEDSLRYRNWGRIIREQEAIMNERDSLSDVVNDASQDGKKKSGLIGRIKRERKDCLEQLDSLNAVIATQRKTIQKLQKLDVLMEERRNTIQ